MSTRHPLFGEDCFREGIAPIVGKLRDYQAIEAQLIERLQHQELDAHQSDTIVLQAWDKGIVETRMLRPPIGQWRQPAYEEFLLRIACSMFSAYKYVAKNRQSKFFNKAAPEVMQFQNLQTV